MKPRWFFPPSLIFLFTSYQCFTIGDVKIVRYAPVCFIVPWNPGLHWNSLPDLNCGFAYSPSILPECPESRNYSFPKFVPAPYVVPFPRFVIPSGIVSPRLSVSLFICTFFNLVFLCLFRVPFPPVFPFFPIFFTPCTLPQTEHLRISFRYIICVSRSPCLPSPLVFVVPFAFPPSYQTSFPFYRVFP